MVNGKHLATFLLGAAAGVAYFKYQDLSEEEREALKNGLKDKADGLKDEAASVVDKLEDYFEELKAKGGDALKEHLGDAENILNDLFKPKAGPDGTETA